MLLSILLGFLILQIAILIHEMGHALAILFFTNNEANVYLGPLNNKRSIKFKIKRVNFHLIFAFYGFCFTKKPETLNKRQTLLIDIGGPLSSFVAFVFFTICWILFKDWYILKIACFANLYLFLFSAFPYTYPSWEKGIGGYPTDGLRIFRALKINTVENLK